MAWAPAPLRPPDTTLVAPERSIQVVSVRYASTWNITVPHAKHLYDGREFGEMFTATVPLSVQGNPIQLVRERQ
jgi:hypothetical protein